MIDLRKSRLFFNKRSSVGVESVMVLRKTLSRRVLGYQLTGPVRYTSVTCTCSNKYHIFI